MLVPYRVVHIKVPKEYRSWLLRILGEAFDKFRMGASMALNVDRVYSNTVNHNRYKVGLLIK